MFGIWFQMAWITHSDENEKNMFCHSEQRFNILQFYNLLYSHHSSWVVTIHKSSQLWTATEQGHIVDGSAISFEFLSNNYFDLRNTVLNYEFVEVFKCIFLCVCFPKTINGCNGLFTCTMKRHWLPPAICPPGDRDSFYHKGVFNFLILKGETVSCVVVVMIYMMVHRLRLLENICAVILSSQAGPFIGTCALYRTCFHLKGLMVILPCWVARLHN